MKKILIALFAALSLLTLAACGQGAEQLGYISADAARTAALSSAGVSAQAATFTGTDLTDRDGVRYYLVAFNADGASYTSQVDALTGVVIQTESAPLTQSAPAEQVVTAEAAKAKALEHAGLTEADVTFIKAELDRENGRTVYDVEFYTADYKEYDYEIDATTGEVVGFDWEVEGFAAPTATQAPAATRAPAATPVPAQRPADIQNSAATLTLDQAKAKALEHAGLSAGEVTFVEAELDRDDGRLVYELEFYTSSGKEYDYEIDAATGEVVKYDYDAEHYAPSTGTSAALDAEGAKALALAQVPGATAADIREFEADRDDGRIQYEGEIVYGGMKYEFEIDGYSGAIREWEAEPLH